MLCIIIVSINILIKYGTIVFMVEEIVHNGNKLNMVTSEKALVENMRDSLIYKTNSSVAILIRRIDIELCQSNKTDTSVNQSLA